MTSPLRAARAAIIAGSRVGRPLRRYYALATNPVPRSTVNDDEIAHFSRLSEHWWDESGEFGMLHKLNPVRATFVRDRVLRTIEDEGHPNSGVSISASSRPLEGLTAVDVGCGGGLLSEARPVYSDGFSPN
jgi:polyprenyldihydroxybenzoate methyltransferase / 3-demethylubiquinol 3-O-methyltransferase